jgi:hypothetical protein
MVEEMDTDVAVVGAGPYGLSVAAHLQAQHTQFRIFGSPMEFWRNSMPQGMQLNSAGGASSLSDPSSSFSLAEYCAERSIPYADQGLPVALETFVSYGLEFQKRFVPTLEQEIVTSITAIAGGFLVVLENGEEFSSRSAVVAVGSGYFSHLPSVLTELPEAMLSHSSRHGDLNRFTDRDVAVVGGGTSALDLAGLLHDAGARPTLIVRQPTIGTAAGWSMRDAVVGHVPVILGASVDAVSTSGGRAHLHLASDADRASSRSRAPRSCRRSSSLQSPVFPSSAPPRPPAPAPTNGAPAGPRSPPVESRCTSAPSGPHRAPRRGF